MSKREPDLIAIESSGFPRELVGRITANMLLPEHRLLAPALPAPCRRWFLLAVGAAFVCPRFQRPGFMGGHRGGGGGRDMDTRRFCPPRGNPAGPRACFCAGGSALGMNAPRWLDREQSWHPGAGLDALRPPAPCDALGINGYVLSAGSGEGV